MIKKCNVVLHNEAVMVIDFDGKKIQMPSVKCDTKDVFVEFKDNKYSLVTANEYEYYTAKPEKKQKEMPKVKIVEVAE